MPWSGYPETEASQLTFTEWRFALRARREVLIGYSIRVDGVWELFGDDRWLWFTGVVAGYSGAAQIVAQWAEVEPMGPTHRVWQWVHWRNPSGADAIVKPYLLLAPPVGESYLRRSQSTEVRRRIWSILDIAASEISAVGKLIERPDDSGGGGGSGGRGLLEPAVALAPLEGQTLRPIELPADLAFLPVEELWGRVDTLTRSAAGDPPPAAS